MGRHWDEDDHGVDVALGDEGQKVAAGDMDGPVHAVAYVAEDGVLVRSRVVVSSAPEAVVDAAYAGSGRGDAGSVRGAAVWPAPVVGGCEDRDVRAFRRGWGGHCGSWSAQGRSHPRQRSSCETGSWSARSSDVSGEVPGDHWYEGSVPRFRRHLRGEESTW